MTSFCADGPAAAAPPTTLPPSPSTPTTWECMLVTDLLVQGHLLELLYTNEVAGLGAVSRRCKASFLAPGLLRSSIQATGPSDATRFQFWKKALRVPEVQRQLLFSCSGVGGDGEDGGPEEEDGGLLDEAGFEVFRTVLYRTSGRTQGGGGEDEVKGDNGDNESEPPQVGAADEESLYSRSDAGAKPQPQEEQQQQRYSGKRMLAQDGQEGEILRDVARTFPLEPLFRDSAGVGQNLLANVLKACLSFHDDTGYMQGMNFVCASFLFALRRRLLPPSPFTHFHPQSHRAPLLQFCDASSSVNHRAGVTTKPTAAVAAAAAGGNIKGTHKAYFPSFPPPDGSGSLQKEGENESPPHNHHHHHHHQQQRGSDGANSPSTTTDEEDGYHSDHSTQTQGSESFSPPPPSYYQQQHPPPTAAAAAATAATTAAAPLPQYQHRALAKKYGFLWECSEEHMHVASDVFWMMTALMSSSSGLSMRLLWHPDVPHMKLRVYQFDRLLFEHLPRLHAHFKCIRLAPDILVTQWHMTLLAYCLPLRVLTRVWDVVFQDGWKALFRISLALLQAVEDDLLVLNLEESGRFLRQWTSKRHPLWRDGEALLKAAKGWKVTRTILSDLQEDFALTLLKEQLVAAAAAPAATGGGVGGGGGGGKNTGFMTGEWLSRYGPPGEEGGEGCCLLKAPELEGLRREIKVIEGPVTRDFGHYRVKIEEASLGCEVAGRRLGELEGRMAEVRMQVEEMEEVCLALQGQVAGIVLLQQQQQKEQQQQREEKEGGTEKAGEEEEGTSTTTAGGRKSSSSMFSNLLSTHRKGFAGAKSVISPSSTSTSGSSPSLASSLLSSIRDLRPLQRRAGGGTVTVEEDRSSSSSSSSSRESAGNPTIGVTSPKARTSSADSWCSVTSPSSSSSSRQSSLDLSHMGKMLGEMAQGKDPSSSAYTTVAPSSSSSSGSSSSGGGRSRTSSASSSKSNSSKSRTSSVGGMLAKRTGTTTAAAPTPAVETIPTVAAAAAAAGQAFDHPHSMDLVVQERKISRADAQLMGLKAHYAALQREKTEAEMALEEAEAFRASLSDQLMHLLQHAEGEVKRRMREVVRSQPRHPHAAAPLALLPNRKVLETARKATLEAQVRRRGSSLEREKEEGGRGGEGVALV